MSSFFRDVFYPCSKFSLSNGDFFLVKKSFFSFIKIVSFFGNRKTARRKKLLLLNFLGKDALRCVFFYQNHFKQCRHIRLLCRVATNNNTNQTFVSPFSRGNQVKTRSANVSVFTINAACPTSLFVAYGALCIKLVLLKKAYSFGKCRISAIHSAISCAVLN